MELGLCFITNQTVLCGQAKDLLKPADHFSLFVVVQSLSHVHLFTTPWTAVCQASLSFTIPCSLLKLMSIESVMPSSHLILCCPLSFSVILCHPLLLLPSIFPSIRVFSNESALCIGWPKYWSFSFSISPSNEYSELKSLLLHYKWVHQYHSRVHMSALTYDICFYLSDLLHARFIHLTRSVLIL